MCKSSKQQIPGKAKVFIFGEKDLQKWPIQRGLYQVYEGYICKGLCQEINDGTSPWKVLVPTTSCCLPSKQDWKDKSCVWSQCRLQGNLNRYLNRELLSGLDLTNQIVGVLLRFREKQIAVMGDTESMFHQVKVPKDQCSFLRFLWWNDSDPDNEIVDYEMTVDVFWGTSLPSCSNFALRRTERDNEQQYGNEITQILEILTICRSYWQSVEELPNSKWRC